MFVNDFINRRTVDHERGLELRYINWGPERPKTYCLTVDGVPIAFDAWFYPAVTADGRPGTAWTIEAVGHSHSSVAGQEIYSIPAYSFADAADRVRIIGLIEEALRVPCDLFGIHPTPDASITFRDA